MCYLKRKADIFLDTWKSDADRKPLIIQGARQVGKTETIRRFARLNYTNTLEINLYEEQKYTAIIRVCYYAYDII